MYMQSRVLAINPGTGRIKAAMEAAEEFSYNAYLDRHHMLRLRLLTEETFGMLREMTGDYQARLWFTAGERDVTLHLEVLTGMDAAKRDDLYRMATSFSGGVRLTIMGRIRTVLEEMVLRGPGASRQTWSLAELRRDLREGKNEELLERSIVANIAEDIRVKVDGNTVHMEIEMPVDWEGEEALGRAVGL